MKRIIYIIISVIVSLIILVTGCVILVNYRSYGEFYSLPEAYDMGLLNDDDVKNIAYYYGEVVINGGMNSEERKTFEQTIKNPIFINNKTQTKIKKSYLHNVLKNPFYPLNDIEIKYYYGYYNNCIVLYLETPNKGQKVDPYFEDIIIGTQEFNSYCSTYITVWIEK